MTDLEGILNIEGGECASLEVFSPENIEYLQSIEGLRSANWEGLSLQERLDCLRTLESRLAEIQNRPPVPIVAEEMEYSGFYDGKVLHVNIADLENPSQRLEIIDTVAHEGRHAYQMFAVSNPWVHPNKTELLYWEANQSAYFQPKNIGEKFGPEYYMNQPIELDAWRYGAMTQEVFTEGPRISPLDQFNSALTEAYAKIENTEGHPSWLERAGAVWDRITTFIDSKLSPDTQRSILRTAALALAHSIRM